MHLCWMLDFATVKKLKGAIIDNQYHTGLYSLEKEKDLVSVESKRKICNYLFWAKYISNMSFYRSEKKPFTGNKAQVSTCCGTRLYKKNK